MNANLNHDEIYKIQPGHGGYAGDITPQLAYRWWQEDEAILLDVRSDAERDWVGFIPGSVALPLRQWPNMNLNPDFDRALTQAALQGKKLLMLCRSGVRSIAAAQRATELGLEAYNILDGFEGDHDEQGHRGQKSGWKFLGLPWRQG